MKAKIIIITMGIILIIGGIFIYYKYFKKIEEKPIDPEIIDTIDQFGYTLSNNDPEIFENEFENLRTVLKSDEIDYEQYAISLSKLFIIDFYNLQTKINKYDVGGLEYIHPTIKDNFELKAMDTIYKYIEDNSDNKRNQELPQINNIILIDIDLENEYKIDKNNVASIVVNLEWTYMKDLSYDSKAQITLIKDDRKLVIVDIQTKTG